MNIFHLVINNIHHEKSTQQKSCQNPAQWLIIQCTEPCSNCFNRHDLYHMHIPSNTENFSTNNMWLIKKTDPGAAEVLGYTICLHSLSIIWKKNLITNHLQIKTYRQSKWYVLILSGFSILQSSQDRKSTKRSDVVDFLFKELPRNVKTWR